MCLKEFSDMLMVTLQGRLSLFPSQRQSRPTVVNLSGFNLMLWKVDELHWLVRATAVQQHSILRLGRLVNDGHTHAVSLIPFGRTVVFAGREEERDCARRRAFSRRVVEGCFPHRIQYGKIQPGI